LPLAFQSLRYPESDIGWILHQQAITAQVIADDRLNRVVVIISVVPAIIIVDIGVRIGNDCRWGNHHRRERFGKKPV
jgi:hypothetical protein